jgi:beta-lactam-binding protein with PASTA domain
MPVDRLETSRKPPKPAQRPLRTRVWSAGRLLLLSTGLAITFGVFFLMSTRVASKAREVQVPDVRGQSVGEATAALSRRGLALRIESRRADPKVAADHVLTQEPDPGTVIRRQRPVRVRVSEGQRDPVLPSVVGGAERTAEVVFAQEQVTIVDRAEIRTTSFPSDVVVAQDPAPKDRSAKVTLLINRGEREASFVMPDVIGAPGVRVVDILRRHGFRVTIATEVPYPGLPPGIVIRQTPQAGFQVGYGDAVSIEVSR